MAESDATEVGEVEQKVKNELDLLNRRDPKEDEKEMERLELLHHDEKEKGEMKLKRIPDGGFVWLPVFGGFLIFMVINGVSSAIGLIYIDISERLGVNEEDLQWIGSLQFGICLCMGIGLGLALTTSFVMNAECFDKRRPLANGIVLCGSGVSQVLYSPLVKVCLQEYGYEGTMIISSAISLNMLVAAVTFSPSLNKSDTRFTETFKKLRDLADKELIKTAFILCFISNILFHLGVWVPYSFLPSTALRYNIDINSVPLLISIVGLSNVFGRPFFGWLAFTLDRKKIMIFTSALLCCAVAIGVMQILKDFISLAVSCVIFGACSGGALCLSFSILPDIIDSSSLSNSIGMTSLAQGVGFVIGTPIGGFLIKMTGNENVVYTYGGLSFLIASILLLPVIYTSRTRIQSFQQEKVYSIEVDNPDKALKFSEINSIK